MKLYTSVPHILSAVHVALLLPKEMGIPRRENVGIDVLLALNRLSDFLIQH